MKLPHLGDALDHWKGSVIRLLKNELTDLRVLPMLTDPTLWNPELFCVYAGLLHVNPGMILKTNIQILPEDERAEYFNVDCQFDLFIDPDTGIGDRKIPSDPDKKNEYIMPSEVASLVPDGSTRMLLIYQQATLGGITRIPHIRGRVDTLKMATGRHYVFAYFAGQTSMVFVSRDTARLSRVRGHLERLLGPVARDDGVPGRIID